MNFNDEVMIITLLCYIQTREDSNPKRIGICRVAQWTHINRKFTLRSDYRNRFHYNHFFLYSHRQDISVCLILIKRPKKNI